MVAAAFIQIDQDRQNEVMINFVSPTGSADPGSPVAYDEATFGTPVALDVCDIDWEHDELLLLGSLPGLRSLHLESGDFDGNGVQDLAADGSDSLILFGQPR
jgi:hypothetical protein